MSYIEKCVVLTGGLEVSFSIYAAGVKSRQHYQGKNSGGIGVKADIFGLFQFPQNARLTMDSAATCVYMPLSPELVLVPVQQGSC